MKKDIHPEGYGKVIYVDDSSGEKFLIPSITKSDKTEKWEDGKEYPVVHVEISSASHPFYTGKENVIDTAGRVEKFKARQAQAGK
ncbi:type B 50S ribosomal protein L31 [Candidatus Parcubacteria bacterium]|nr:type B 50S ribosomal protein L31 [Candidatus Parcubacteria bacterium]